MTTVALSTENFESIVADNDTVFIDFWATWCGPCRMFGPVFEAASENIRFAHDKLREAAYAGIEEPRRTELHGRAVDAIAFVVADRRLTSAFPVAARLGSSRRIAYASSWCGGDAVQMATTLWPGNVAGT